MGGKGGFLLSEDSELLRLNLILQVRGPGLEKQLGRLGIEDLLLWHQRLWIHGHWGLLSKQTCMERVLWQEGLAELGVAQLSIVILVKASHEKRDLVVGDFETKVFEPVH